METMTEQEIKDVYRDFLAKVPEATNKHSHVLNHYCTRLFEYELSRTYPHADFRLTDVAAEQDLFKLLSETKALHTPELNFTLTLTSNKLVRFFLLTNTPQYSKEYWNSTTTVLSTSRVGSAVNNTKTYLH